MTSNWILSKEQVAELYQTSETEGLSNHEAASRLQKYGQNALPKEVKTSPLSILYEQFSSFIVWALIVAALIAGYLGEWVDCLAIIIIVIVNAILGFVQEWRSIRAMEALTKLEHPIAKVVRQGGMKQVSIEDLVPGDLIVVEAGDQVPADGRLVTSYHLKVEEAALTGESVGIAKTVKPLLEENLLLGDQVNMIFRGTTVVYGKGLAIVTATGLSSEIGKLLKCFNQLKRGRHHFKFTFRN